MQEQATNWATPRSRDFKTGEDPKRRTERGGLGTAGLNDEAATWPTPSVPNGGRSSSTSNYNDKGEKRQIDLGAKAATWPSPRGEDSEQAGNHPSKIDSLTGAIRNWPTPTAQDSAEAGGMKCIETRGRGESLTSKASTWPSPNVMDSKDSARHTTTTDVMHPGTTLTDAVRAQKWPTPSTVPDAPNTNSNQKTGEPCLGDAARSLFSHLDQPTLTPGDECSPSDPTLPPLWQTPNAQLFGSRRQVGDTERQPMLIKQAENWRTPAASDDRRGPHPSPDTKAGEHSLTTQSTQWKTPHGMANTDVNGKTGGAGGEHQKQVMTVTGNQPKAQLNPRFDEWLMGWPPGWTDFAPVVTEWCRWRQRMRFALSRLVSGGTSGRPSM